MFFRIYFKYQNFHLLLRKLLSGEGMNDTKFIGGIVLSIILLSLFSTVSYAQIEIQKPALCVEDQQYREGNCVKVCKNGIEVTDTSVTGANENGCCPEGTTLLTDSRGYYYCKGVAISNTDNTGIALSNNAVYLILFIFVILLMFVYIKKQKK